LFGDSVVAEAEEIYEIIVKSHQGNIIEIPPIDMVQQEVSVWCERFDLDTVSGFTYQPQGEEIPVVELTGERKIDTIGVRHEAYIKDNPVQQLVSELIDYSDVDYDENAELLFRLAQQADKSNSENLEDPGKLVLTIRQFRKHIAHNIHQQMRANFWISEPDYI